MAAAAAAATANTGSGCRGVGGDSGCSTPFVSALSSPARDPSFHLAAAGCYFSAPASPARGAGDGDHEYEYEFDFDFDFSSRFPSPAGAAMSSADELFHNGQIRPMRLSSFLLRPQALPPHAAALPAGRPRAPVKAAAPADERGGRLRSRSVHRRSRSLSPFRTQWMSPSSSSSPAPAKESAETPTSSSRSSSSSSTASCASSSSSRSYRRWRFLKDLVHRSKSDGGKRPLPPPSPPVPKRNPSPAAARGRVRRRSSHERLYEARRAEAEEMRRRTFLPYRQGLLLGCLGLGSRGYGAMHGFAAAKSRA